MIFQRKIRSRKEIQPDNKGGKGLAGAKPGGGVIPTHEDTHGLLESQPNPPRNSPCHRLVPRRNHLRKIEPSPYITRIGDQTRIASVNWGQGRGLGLGLSNRTVEGGRERERAETVMFSPVGAETGGWKYKKEASGRRRCYYIDDTWNCGNRQSPNQDGCWAPD